MQVAKEALRKPVCIATFDLNGKGGDVRVRISTLEEKLIKLGIDFAEVSADSSIEIFIEEANLEDN